MKRSLAVLLWWALWLAPAAPAAPGLEAPPTDLAASEVARRANDNLRGDRVYMSAIMTVESPRLTSARSVRFESWDDREGDRSFIRIHEPTKDAGTGFLKRDTNLWMYVPRVERTMRVPPSMMLQSWMGSDFTNDDLVKESSEVEDYDHAWLGVAADYADGADAYVIEYRPHEDAPVVWGRIVAWIHAETHTPLRQEFYDEDGEKLRELVFSDHKTLGQRHMPHLWTLTPLDKEGHRTTIRVKQMDFDAAFEEAIFTRRYLEREVRR